MRLRSIRKIPNRARPKTLSAENSASIRAAASSSSLQQVTSGSGTIDQAQLAAYNSQAYNSSWPIVSSQTTAAYQTIAFNYLTLFYKSWNQTFTATTYIPLQLFVGAFARAQNVTKGSPLL